MILIISALSLLLPFILWPACYDGALLPRMLVLHVGAAGALAMLMQKEKVSYPILIPSTAFIAVVALSALRAPLPLVGLAAPLHYCCLFALVICGANLTWDNLRTILRWAVVGGTISAVLAIAQYLGWFTGIALYKHPAALFLNRNLLAEYLVTVIPGAWYLSYRENDKIKRFLFIGCLGLMIVALMLTGCRGAIVGLAGALSLSLIIRYNNIFLRGILVAPFVGPAITDRLQYWFGTVQMICDHPLGVGPDGWARFFPLYDNGMTQAAVLLFRSPHNDLLWLTAEYGLPGLACLLWMAWIVGKALKQGLSGLSVCPSTNYEPLETWKHRVRETRSISMVCGVTIGALVGASMFAFPSQNAAALLLPCLMTGYVTKGGQHV